MRTWIDVVEITRIGQTRVRPGYRTVPLADAVHNCLSLVPPVNVFERINPHLAKDYAHRDKNCAMRGG